MRIVLFGLTGDPVTSAHMEIIERLSKSYDKVVVIPTNVNYYKNYKGHDRAMFSFTERYDNLVNKCKPYTNVDVNDLERDITEGWRFYHTLIYLMQEFCSPLAKDRNDKMKSVIKAVDEGFADRIVNFANSKNNEFYIAIGSDSLQTFKTWFNWEKILEVAKLVVFNRPGYTDGFPEGIEYEYLEMNNDISSTKVRKNLMALMDKFEDEIEEDDFDIWIDDLTWAKDYVDNGNFKD